MVVMTCSRARDEKKKKITNYKLKRHGPSTQLEHVRATEKGLVGWGAEPRCRRSRRKDEKTC